MWRNWNIYIAVSLWLDFGVSCSVGRGILIISGFLEASTSCVFIFMLSIMSLFLIVPSFLFSSFTLCIQPVFLGSALFFVLMNFLVLKKIKINVNLVMDWLRRYHIIDEVNQTPYHTMFRRGIHAAILTVQKLVKQKIVICLGWSTKVPMVHPPEFSKITLLPSNTWIK